MPLYTYECSSCGEQEERVYKVDECPRTIQCLKCHEIMVKVILPGHGGIKTDGDVPWLASAAKVLQPDHERPIETRGEYNRYLKDNNIIAAG